MKNNPHPLRHFEIFERHRLPFRDVNQSAASRPCGVHRIGNLSHHGTHQAPSVFAENHDRQFAAFQILLVRQICSVVRSTSNPASSAAFSKSPLLNVSHPCALASLTIWSSSAAEMPLGVTWSKRMSINGESELQDSVPQSPVLP